VLEYGVELVVVLKCCIETRNTPLEKSARHLDRDTAIVEGVTGTRREGFPPRSSTLMTTRMLFLNVTKSNGPFHKTVVGTWSLISLEGYSANLENGTTDEDCRKCVAKLRFEVIGSLGCHLSEFVGYKLYSKPNTLRAVNEGAQGPNLQHLHGQCSISDE